MENNEKETIETKHIEAKNRKEKAPEYTPNLEYDFFKSNSTTDCTGVVPRLPQTDAELDSYLDVYNFLPQCAISREKPQN